jgi:hypothetical protein
MIRRRMVNLNVKCLGNQSDGFATLKTGDFLQGICHVASHVSKHHAPAVSFIVSTVLMPHSDIENAMQTIVSNPRPRHFRGVRVDFSGGRQWELFSLAGHVIYLTFVCLMRTLPCAVFAAHPDRTYSCWQRQYSKLSTRAIQLASITFSLTPTVPQVSVSSWLSMTTRTPAAVDASELITRTL